MAEFARILKVVTDRFVKGAPDETIQNSIILSELKKRGRIKYNLSGKALTWDLKVKQRALDAVDDMESLEFARQNIYEQLTLPWRGYRAQDVISNKERLMCKGNEALVNIWGEKMESLMSDANDRLSAELFVDGNASGNTKKFHGIESIFGAASATTTSEFATSSETYAGVSPAAVHGTESATSPYSPQLVHEDYTSYSSWTTSATKIMRSLVSACSIRNNKKGRPDLAMKTESRFNAFKNLLASKEQIIAGPPTPGMLYAGAKGVAYDGVIVTWDFDCPADVTYMLNFDQIELNILSSKLWFPATGYKVETDAHLFSVNIWGNMKFNSPRYQGKSGAFA